MLDVHVTVAEMFMPHYSQPEAEQRLVLDELGWDLPPQPPPCIPRPQLHRFRSSRSVMEEGGLTQKGSDGNGSDGKVTDPNGHTNKKEWVFWKSSG
jgi:hypothetical protein